MFVTNVETRNNQIAASLKVSEPGDLAKILTNNMGHQVITEEDCGTHNGVRMDADNPQIIDRFLAHPYKSYPYNTLITPEIFTKLSRTKGAGVTVRSPMTCEAHDGVCQRCFGLNENGEPHNLGTNVGTRAAQAITEPLTQFTLSAKHGLQQADADTKARIQGLKGLREFLDMPASFANKAVVSPEDGVVKNITKAPQGGHYIELGEKRLYAHPDLPPIVKTGQRVYAGDALTDGIPMINEVVAHKGLGAGRAYTVNRVHDTYKRQGVDVDRRHVEMLAKSHLNHVRIVQDPHGRFLPGDVVDYNRVNAVIAHDPVKKVKLDQSAIGQTLARPYAEHMAGTRVTREIVDKLGSTGVHEVEVLVNPPKMEFVVPSITRAPLLNPDWMARMGHRYLKNTLLEGAGFGQTANLESTHPLPGYVYGANFGTSKLRY